METRTKLCYGPSAGRNTTNVQEYLIFHIPGNPGLIPYYDPFFSTLHTLLESTPDLQSSNFHICGHSLLGFETSEHDAQRGPPELAGLEKQIKYIDGLLYDHVDEVRQKTGGITPKVILMGHSVGAYILLEIIRRHRKQIEGGCQDFDLIGGILLFPTITHIARSPSGIVASALLGIPGSAHIGSAIVKALTYFIPSDFLNRLVRLIMRFPEHAARATTALIKSPIGIKEILYLAKDEMNMITDDKWGEEIWGAATDPGTSKGDTIHSNLIFFWGNHDAWVAQKTRDELIRARGFLEKSPDNWKPTMHVDERMKIPHSFCLKHSEVVAEKVREWVGDIIDVHNQIGNQ
ncbi:MAG: hypothetical protein LQ348_003434 [Seirophora lacunosa]|nr:MAG: hypothetical protein LQ344_003348 [Seirophora lacunosa]KAI4191755.1 MAG: hypothetical protein LQ348_003434 [Seirophora lacunosa]